MLVGYHLIGFKVQFWFHTGIYCLFTYAILTVGQHTRECVWQLMNDSANTSIFVLRIEIAGARIKSCGISSKWTNLENKVSRSQQ